ncbi:hypothetical protein EVAR_87736_1 [Eumeta japonica]|uniref:Uncharacterized protein n=1 Tax=Eumeta variegata TaxID=151549 RepID=A0A4C1ZPF9_EUMVA|nr:hypothetical protein EVAR_87736_1 [Eumeta japonica]
MSYDRYILLTKCLHFSDNYKQPLPNAKSSKQPLAASYQSLTNSKQLPTDNRESLCNLNSMFEILQPEKLPSSSNEEMLNASGRLSAKYSKDISINLCDQLKALKTCLKSKIKKISSIKELIELLLVKFNRCEKCRTEFSVSHSGAGDIEQHLKSEKHKMLIVLLFQFFNVELFKNSNTPSSKDLILLLQKASGLITLYKKTTAFVPMIVRRS